MEFDNIDCNVSEPSSAAKEPEEAGTSNRTSIPDNLMELHHENRAEFFETVQLHCKAVMERVRAVKESLNLSDPSKQSQRSSDKEKLSDFSPERTEGKKEQCFGLNAQDQGQKIKENVERIIELVRSGKKMQFSNTRLSASEKLSFPVATTDAGQEPRQQTSPAVEEKTVQSEKTTENSVPVGSSLNLVEETKLSSAYSVLDGKALMELSNKDTCLKVPSLKECGDGITHSASPYRKESPHEHDQSHSALSLGDCKGLFEEISSEEQTALTVNEIEKDISVLMNEENQLTGRNSTFDMHVDTSFEYLNNHSSFSIQAHLKKANDSSVLSGSQKMMPWSRRVEDPLWQIAVKIVRDIYVRIGCHENYLRYASWVDEPNDYTIKLDTTALPCNDALSNEKITIPEGNDNDSENVDKLCSDGMASTALESTHSNAEEPSMETSSFQTDQLEVASVNASYDAQRTPKMPVKRASLRRGQKKWSALKKRRKSLAFGRKENETNGSRKPLTMGKSTAEVAGLNFNQEGSTFENSENPLQKERRQIGDGERLSSLKGFISLKDARTKDGEDIIVVNPSKIPSKRDFTGRKEYNEIMARLLLFVQEFTEEEVKSEKFVVAVHAVTQRRSKLRSRKWATEFYKLLMNRYQNRLVRCVFFKPSFKLRALVILSKPFFSNDMREKIVIVKSRRKFSKAQGLPDSDSTEQT